MDNILIIENVEKNFGGLKVLENCSFNVRKNSITALIGPNGAGKTTLFNVVSGFIPLSNGKVYFNGELITALPAYKVATKGLVRSFQTAVGFTNLTVLENLMVSANSRGEYLWNVMYKKRYINQEKNIEKEAYFLLESAGLVEKADMQVSSLSIGEIRCVQLLCLLMMKPKLLMLDEPTSGISLNMQREMKDILFKYKAQGLTMLIIEHNISFIMGIADWVYVLANGKVISAGTPQDITRDERVIELYLGSGGAL